MKKCPSCGTITSDDRQTCGLCGASLAGAVSLTRQQVEQLPSPEFHSKKEIDRAGIVGVLAGVVVLITGLIVLFFGFLSPGGLGLLGFGITVVGVILILSGVDTVARRPYRASFGAMSIRQSGSGRRYIEREAEREEQEERDRESGAAD